MNIWTVHVREGAAPALVAEGFSWGALVFGPLWLGAHRAWVPAVLAGCVEVALRVAVPGNGVRLVLLAAFAWLLGLFGQDLRRWGLARRGFGLAHVVAGATREDATLRLLEGCPDLAPQVLP